MKSDTLKVMDNQEVTCLVLALSTAFNTVHHGILLNRLDNMFGIQSTLLKWIESYLTGRTPKVAIGDLSTNLGACSDSVTLTWHSSRISTRSKYV